MEKPFLRSQLLNDKVEASVKLGHKKRNPNVA